MSILWIQTYSGKKFDFLNLDESMICIEDIAHHLSILNRWVGATRFPFSVAYHSLIVSKYCVGFELEGLLHDAEEAYINDMSYPLKETLKTYGDTIYHSVGNNIKQIIATKFKLNFYKYKDEIKINDLRSAKTERNQLLLKPTEQYSEAYENAEPFNDVIMNLSYDNIERLFLKTYEKYRRI